MNINNIRIIPYEIHHGSRNMAVDHYFANCEAAEPFAVFRFYGWNPCCISLGYHQDISLVNTNLAGRHKIDLVRRPTGGSAVLHCDELTYSVIISKKLIDHQALYSLMHKIIAAALNALNYNVYLEDSVNNEKTAICYNRAAKSEIKYDGKKLVGSAQRIYPQTILQHGSILFSNTQMDLLQYFNYRRNEIENYKTQLINKSIALEDISAVPIDRNALIEKIIEQIDKFFKGFIYYQYLTAEEITAVSGFENNFFEI